MSNPFLLEQEFVQYDQIKPEHLVPAAEEAIKQAKVKFKEIVAFEGQRTFENTIMELIWLEEKLEKVLMPMSHLFSVSATEQYTEEYAKVDKIQNQFLNEYKMDPDLYRIIKEYAETDEAKKLEGERKVHLDNVIKGLKLSGAELSDDKKEELKKINMDLSELSLKFNNNVLASTFDLIITDEKDLAGLPEDAIEAAKAKGEQLKKDGKTDKDCWAFNLDFPSYYPFMKYSENDELRKKLWFKYMSKGKSENPEKDNTDIVKNILKLRKAKAKLLGFDTYADLSLELKMAKSPKVVKDFLDDIATKLETALNDEYEELKNFIKEKTGEKPEHVMSWQSMYWSNKLKEEKFSFSEEEVKQYFELNSSIGYMFEIVNKIFGLSFEKVEGIPVWHKDITVYKIFDESGDLRSYIYFDLHPRSGLKRAGAWMNQYVSGKNDINERVIPQVGVHCNFTEPVGDKPALLTYDEVETLYHEFGHALHGALTKTELSATAGTNVAWDVVELPSTFMENFIKNKKTLPIIAKHYKTREAMPADLIDKVIKSTEFMRATFATTQIYYGIFDMTLHYDENLKDDMRAPHDISRELYKKYIPSPYQEDSYFENGFSHIFGGGYAAGYYSYMWANILEADAFSLFEEGDTVLDRDKGRSFMENILEKGGSEDMNVLFERFRGRPVSPKPLLKRFGIEVE